jgi:hypothetical protein
MTQPAQPEVLNNRAQRQNTRPQWVIVQINGVDILARRRLTHFGQV